jgi:hypothetical protein
VLPTQEGPNIHHRLPDSVMLAWLRRARRAARLTLELFPTYPLDNVVIGNYDKTMPNIHAVELGRLGGLARALSTTAAQRAAWGRLGGLARASNHSREKLAEWARIAGSAPKRRRAERKRK